MNQIKVSIITVTYNCAKTLEQTIQSVFCQTYSNIEYIIIDGGSTDGTIEIIKKYEDKITYWVSEPDDGIYDAMNKGIAKATGEIIGILNADDWYHEYAVGNAVYWILKSGCDVVHGDVELLDSQENSYRVLHPKSIENIWHCMVFNHPTCFVRTSVYQRLGVFSSIYEIAGDYELFLRFYCNDVIFQYCSEVLVYMRLGGASDQRKFIGFREVRDIAIHYGYNIVFAYGWYLYIYFRNRVSLSALGLQWLSRFKFQVRGQQKHAKIRCLHDFICK